MMHTFPFGFMFWWFVFIPLGIMGMLALRRIFSHLDDKDRRGYRRGRYEKSRHLSRRRNREIDSGRLESGVYRLAGKLGGIITVSDLVVHMGIGADQAEELMNNMTDGYRIRMEVGNNGIITYEFPELMENGPWKGLDPRPPD
ncbi:MAG: hypothetical protein DRP87_18310 [Spirochaetes bacterium]|nr:MAG: hypothetical protein DRP87_18310 [Spirochaetota bacterium]